MILPQRPLPPGYVEHEPALLAGRRFFLATWHLANGLPAEAHLDVLRVWSRTEPTEGRTMAASTTK